jgi:hypothetical protein
MELGRVFTKLPRVGTVDGCTYCYSQADLDILGGDPALVPDHLVLRFARSAPDHWTETQYAPLWRGLAPRILGLLEHNPDEMLLRGLPSAHFATWRDGQQAAVRDALRTVLARVITGGMPTEEVIELVGAAAHTDQDVTPWLSYLDTLTGAAADTAVAGVARYWAEDLASGGTPSPWWRPEYPAAPIQAWLYSDALHARLNRMDDVDTLVVIAEL